MTDRAALAKLTDEIVACRACPRLVEWRERVAVEKVARFRDEAYWGKPLPGFGDPDGRILIIGLAPAAHGGNRTGRVFTGDKSGDFLWAALHKADLADRPSSRRADDGLTLADTYIAAAVRRIAGVGRSGAFHRYLSRRRASRRSTTTRPMRPMTTR